MNIHVLHIYIHVYILSLYPVDSLDNCEVVANAAQNDTDDDGIGDACDNCVFNNNTAQENVDGDIAGAVCDANDADPRVGGFNLFSIVYTYMFNTYKLLLEVTHTIVLSFCKEDSLFP